MKVDSNTIVVTTSVCGECDSVHVTSVHHRDFPEVRAEGESPEAAAAELANRLSRDLGSIADRWQSEPVREAIADVRAFLARGDDRGLG